MNRLHWINWLYAAVTVSDISLGSWGRGRPVKTSPPLLVTKQNLVVLCHTTCKCRYRSTPIPKNGHPGPRHLGWVNRLLANTTTIRLRFDCNSTALLPFDDLCHDHMALQKLDFIMILIIIIKFACSFVFRQPSSNCRDQLLGDYL